LANFPGDLFAEPSLYRGFSLLHIVRHTASWERFLITGKGIYQVVIRNYVERKINREK
jgi:hypothetical protein